MNQQSLRILRLEAENVMKLKAVSITPDGNIIQITGENGSGKSSVLNAIHFALGGKAVIAGEPIRRGEDKASIRLELGEDGQGVELTVIRRFSGAGTSLVVQSPEGAVFSSPQDMLNRLLGQLSFDPLEFARLTPKARLETLRKIVKIDEDLDAIDRESKEAYDARTVANRRAGEYTTQRTHYLSQYDMAVDGELVDVDALLTQMANATEHNRAIMNEQARRNELTERHRHCQQKALEYRQKAEQLMAAAESETTNALALEADIDELPPIAKGIVTEELRGKITEAQTTNRVREEQHRISAALEDAKVKEQAALAESKALTDRISALTARKEAAIVAAAMPIPGLSFGEGEITYNGIPFSQASTAEQIRVATAIGIALNPRLRIVSIKDGSLLDAKSLAILEQMAEQHNVQVWLERVSSGQSVGIEMVDGSVATVNGLPVEVPDSEIPEA